MGGGGGHGFGVRGSGRDARGGGGGDQALRFLTGSSPPSGDQRAVARRARRRRRAQGYGAGGARAESTNRAREAKAHPAAMQNNGSTRSRVARPLGDWVTFVYYTKSGPPSSRKWGRSSIAGREGYTPRLAGRASDGRLIMSNFRGLGHSCSRQTGNQATREALFKWARACASLRRPKVNGETSKSLINCTFCRKIVATGNSFFSRRRLV
jgi:hypothetical protein